MEKRDTLKHFVMLAVMLIASSGTVSAQMSDAIKAAMESDMSTWNFSTTKTVEIDGVNFRFRVDDNLGLAEWYYVNSSNSYSEELNIPETVTIGEKEYVVVASYGYAAYEQRNTTKINLPQTMRRLGDYTFYPFFNVKNITIPENVEVLGSSVFYTWTNQNIHFTSVTPPTVGSLTGNKDSYHVKVFVPSAGFRDYVKTEGIEGQCIISEDWNQEGAFSTVNTGQCSSGELGYIVVSDILPDVRTYAEVNKLIINKGTIDKTDWYAMRQMPNLIYLDLSGLSIEEIPAGALDNCWQLETIIFPESLKYIRERALRNTGVRELNFPNGLSEISGSENFRNCDSLTSVTIPDGVTTLPNDCFYDCNNLHEVNLPNFLTSMGSYCFDNCDLYELHLPGTLKGVSDYCFSNNKNLTKIVFADGPTYVGYYSFSNCERLGESEPVSLPSSMRTLYDYSFRGCTNMIAVNLNEGLENIYSYAFSGCKTLKEVTLPSSLIYCLNYPFYGCSGIESISSLALLPPTVRNYVITYEARNIQLRVPLWSFQEYMTTPGWLEFQANMVIDPNIRPDNVVINKEFEFVLGEDQNLKDYEPNIRMLYNSDEIDDGFGNRKYERGNLTISNRSKLKINDFSMFFSPYAKYYADYSLFYSNRNYDSYRTVYNPNSLIVKGELRAENQTINMMLYNDRWQFISFPFDVKMTDIVPENNLTQWVVRRYDGAERAAQHFDNTWKNLTKDDMLEAGKGYIMKCYLNNPEDYLVRFTVTPDVETVNRQRLFSPYDHTTELADYPTENPQLTSDRSWNLIGNPYPCYYDSRYIDTEAPFMVWDSYNGKYVAFSPIDDNYVLNPGEAFFIQRPTDSDGKLVFREGGRQTHRNPNDLTVEEVKAFVFGERNLSEEMSQRMVLNLTLTGEETMDRTRVVFNDKAAMVYEVSRDAALFAPVNPEASQIWTEADGVKYAINERPLADGIVELSVRCGKTGEYTIALGDNSRAESIVLVDRQNGKKTLISTEQGYTFEAHAGDITGRFYLCGDEATAINGVAKTASAETETYNLKGQKVRADERGIVIKNGSKMLNK